MFEHFLAGFTVGCAVYWGVRAIIALSRPEHVPDSRVYTKEEIRMLESSAVHSYMERRRQWVKKLQITPSYCTVTVVSSAVPIVE